MTRKYILHSKKNQRDYNENQSNQIDLPSQNSARKRKNKRGKGATYLGSQERSAMARDLVSVEVITVMYYIF